MTMNQEEFVRTILPIKNKLFAYAFKIVQSGQEAEDVVQDVLLKVWEKRDELDSLGSVEAWCMTLTRNRSLDKLKLKSNNNQSLGDEHHAASKSDSPLRVVEMKDIKYKLRKVVDGLPLKQREVIVLRDFQGHSYREIAEIMKIDVNLVKVTIHRARQAVKSQILKIADYGIKPS